MSKPSRAEVQIRTRLNDILKSKKLKEYVEKYGDQAITAVDMLSGYLNPSADMTDDQASSVAVLCFDRWSMRPEAPSIPELMMVATFVNTCKH